MAKEGTERTLLRASRLNRGLSQSKLADAIGYSREAVSGWERGCMNPHPDAITALCTFFGKDPIDLDLVPYVDPEEKASKLAMSQKILNDLNLDRREVLEFISGLSAFVGVDLSLLLRSSGVVASEDFLDPCNAAIKACWQLLKHDGLTFVDSILKAYLPTLTKMADQPSDYQHLAASLAVQTKTLEGLLAMHRLDYMSCEIYRASGVRYGRLSGNNRLLAAALADQGDIYMDLAQYKRAILIYNEGLGILDHNAPLNKTALSSGVAYAYALDRQEEQAIKMIGQAREAMPKHPEQDPLYHLIDFGLPDLDRTEGRVYLSLAKKNRDYAEKAYYAFAQGASKHATSSRSESQTLIHQADASLAIGDLSHFIDCLEQGLTIALQIDSKKRKNEAQKVLHKAPEAWKKEAKYQELVKMF